jgi:hypothetical protein
MVSLVDSPLEEMTVTVGLDMVSRVGVAVVSIADLSWWWKLPQISSGGVG